MTKRYMHGTAITPKEQDEARKRVAARRKARAAAAKSPVKVQLDRLLGALPRLRSSVTDEEFEALTFAVSLMEREVTCHE